jgi:tetratricopeptide (TPR) repeat protein
MRDNGDEKQLDNSIANLLKMAKKDKYDNYRDIIYYSAAQLGLKKPDTTNSIVYLQKAIKYNSNNIDYRNKSFFQLANIAYDQGRFKDAASLYDSLQLSTTEADIDLQALNDRKESLAKLVVRLDNIAHEDSVQRIAALPVAEREAFVKKILKKLRKEQGLKEEDVSAGTAPITFAVGRAEDTDLFTSNNSKGEWYFYNSNLKSKGYNEFISRWGKRSNVDNWRRRKSTVGNLNLGNVGADVNTPNPGANSDSLKVADLTIDALMLGLPLTPEKLDTSNQQIAINMLELAKVFQNDLQEYQLAINAYDDYLDRFPGDKNEAEAYLGLYFSYNKLGNTAKANYYKNLLTTKHAASPSAALVTNPSLLQPNLKNNEGTARYEGIYNLFIEGKFAEALETKKKADSLYGNNYWTPQLLYIESIYHIREKNDSTAIAVLKNLQTLYPASPLKDKAGTMIEVLGRRAQIEDYLTKLEVTRAEEEKIIISDDPTPVVKAVTETPVAPVKTTTEPTIKPISRDTSFTVPPVSVNAGFSIQPEKAHFVVVLLDKVDGVYINEAKNAFTRFNKGNYLTQNLVINRDTLDASRTLLLISNFEDAESAIIYHDKIKKAAPREVSWLPANKYSFFIISGDNLQHLKSGKDLEGYKKLLNASFGNKF